MNIKITLKDCQQNCGKQHINGVHPDTIDHYNRHGKCRFCGNTLGTRITDEPELMELGYHADCYERMKRLRRAFG